MEWLFADAPDMAAIEAALVPLLEDQNLPAALAKALRVETVEDRDWLEVCYQKLAPFSAGDFFIYGSHHDGGIPEGQTGLLIDAVQAFGSGSHGTTYGCIELLQYLRREEQFTPDAVLDLGTGSGILAVTAARLWPAPVKASDIEEESVAAAIRHAGANGVQDRIECILAEGFAHPRLRDGAPYGLVIANILPGVLIDLSGDIAAHTAASGYILLSGIPDDRAGDVLDAYAAKGFKPVTRTSRDKWSSLLLKKSG